MVTPFPFRERTLEFSAVSLTSPLLAGLLATSILAASPALAEEAGKDPNSIGPFPNLAEEAEDPLDRLAPPGQEVKAAPKKKVPPPKAGAVAPKSAPAAPKPLAAPKSAPVSLGKEAMVTSTSAAGSATIEGFEVKDPELEVVLEKNEKGESKFSALLVGSFTRKDWTLLSGTQRINVGASGNFSYPVEINGKVVRVNLIALSPQGKKENMEVTIVVRDSIDVMRTGKGGPLRKLTGLAMDLSIFLGASYSQATVATGKSSPFLVRYSGGLQITYFPFNRGASYGFLTGLRSDFRILNQHSSAGLSGGNYRGTRWNPVSPVLGWAFNKFTVAADFQFLGGYNLTSDTVLGGDETIETRFTSPLGGSLFVSFKPFAKIPKLAIGPSFEAVTYGVRAETSSVTGTEVETTLTTRQLFWSAGAQAELAL